MKSIIVVLSLLLIIAGLGCAALSSYVTPAPIDQSAVKYAVNAGVADTNDYIGYPNLVKADSLKKDVDAAHSTIQLDLGQQMQKDDLDYSIHKDVVSSNLVLAQQREEMLFGETGLLSLGLSMAGFGTLTGLIGLMRKRPGDVTQPELEQALADATGKTTEELSTKQRQFTQVVMGIQKLMDTYEDNAGLLPGNAFVIAMKNTFDKTQDTDTQIAVSAVKKSV